MLDLPLGRYDQQKMPFEFLEILSMDDGHYQAKSGK
jgi:hypothetical protein